MISLNLKHNVKYVETYNSIALTCRSIGITRISSLTNLDLIGIPTVQAVRPISRNYSVSQGKGFTLAQALLSAFFEAYEMHICEDPPVDEIATEECMVRSLCYPHSTLPNRAPLNIHRSPMAWTRSWDLLSNRESYVPTDLFRLDFSCQSRRRASPYHPSSGGIGAGFTAGAALSHAILEAVERHWAPCVNYQNQPNLSDLPFARRLLERTSRCGIQLGIGWEYVPLGFWVARACMGTSADTLWFSGTGAGVSADQALSAAILEAAQSRMTRISGARDDIADEDYEWTASLLDSLVTDAEMEMEILSLDEPQPKQEFSEALAHQMALAGKRVWIANLSRARSDLPVYYAFIPGLQGSFR